MTTSTARGYEAQVRKVTDKAGGEIPVEFRCRYEAGSPAEAAHKAVGEILDRMKPEDAERYGLTAGATVSVDVEGNDEKGRRFRWSVEVYLDGGKGGIH